ncbi:beta-fructofuranosidase [Striga asiatica]|uniref:beta-fructofuranosidase n=1 Tax=Striga asiatica TaxID=4170 RepID=A0A5A7PP87_STRAF|nr:beta-fructofuranosidase [Striga asiatica]
MAADHDQLPDSRISCPYTPLIDAHVPPEEATGRRRRRRRTSAVVLLLMSGLLGAALVFGNGIFRSEGMKGSGPLGMRRRPPEKVVPAGRGVAEGVSRKSFFGGLRGPRPYSWSDSALAWQRTAFHFQPESNWMNGPVFYNGWYHFFYQYNPYDAVWGIIMWGHAVSKDLIHWRHLSIALSPDQWYDVNGVWTGSATILENGQLIMLYTGSTNESVQVQNLAYPADPSDPLLVNWVKYPGNPVLLPPPNTDPKDFRDPTTAWLTPHGKWRLTIGSKINDTGMSLVYDTEDFVSFELLEGVLHAVPGTGMWECVDFYPVSRVAENGLDTSENGPEVKHAVKTSLDDDRNDYYALGSYDAENGTWTPDDPSIDVGIGLRYDYGIFYASKTFYDQEKKRRVLWGWIKETDSEAADLRKGWASLQAIPRTVVLDRKTGSNLILWPVEEVERLRQDKRTYDKIEAKPGSILSLDVRYSSQLDIVAEFEVDEEALERIEGTNMTYSCTTSGGAAQRGALGPFGLLVHADKDQIEKTPIYFYISKDLQGNLTTFFCADHSRSSEATDVDKAIYGSVVPVLKGEKLSVRILMIMEYIEF